MSDGSATPSELERQIEAARVDLARSVDAIVDRVHPKRVMRRTVGRVKERVGGLLPAHVDGVVRQLPPGKSARQRGGLPVRKEYLIAAGAVVAAGAVAAVIWYRRRS